MHLKLHLTLLTPNFEISKHTLKLHSLASCEMIPCYIAFELPKSFTVAFISIVRHVTLCLSKAARDKQFWLTKCSKRE